MKPTILFILKAPVVGKVKTRLAEDVGEVRALAAYQKMAAHLFDQLAPSFPYEIHYAPEEEEELMVSWLGPKHPFFPQPEGDLGRRMAAAVKGAFARKACAAVLLGGDCPYVSPRTIWEASTGLLENDIVIGPALDGGYYLLALKKPIPHLFAKIPWSTEFVFSATLEKIKAEGLTVKMLEPMEDVDDLESWSKAEYFLGEKIAASE